MFERQGQRGPGASAIPRVRQGERARKHPTAGHATYLEQTHEQTGMERALRRPVERPRTGRERYEVGDRASRGRHRPPVARGSKDESWLSLARRVWARRGAALTRSVRSSEIGSFVCSAPAGCATVVEHFTHHPMVELVARVSRGLTVRDEGCLGLVDCRSGGAFGELRRTVRL